MFNKKNTIINLYFLNILNYIFLISNINIVINISKSNIILLKL